MYNIYFIVIKGHQYVSPGVSLTHSDFVYYLFSVLNIGTSCQLAVVVPDSVCAIDSGDSPNLAKNVTREALQLLPFFKGRKVITAASLSGTRGSDQVGKIILTACQSAWCPVAV